MAATERVVPLRREPPAGGGLIEEERLLLAELARQGPKKLAEQRGVSETVLDARLAELMHRADARAFLARCMDARVVGILAPTALDTALELMNKAASDRTRLAAARLAFELVGVLGGGAQGGMPAAVKGAEHAAAQAARMGTTGAFTGASPEDLLKQIEAIEAKIVEGTAEELPPAGMRW
jgi:hypothetical protein